MIRLPAEGLTLAYRAAPPRPDARRPRTSSSTERTAGRTARHDPAPAIPRSARARRVRAVHARRAARDRRAGVGCRAARRPANRKAVDGCWRPVNAVGGRAQRCSPRRPCSRARPTGLLDADEQALVLRRRADADAWTDRRPAAARRGGGAREGCAPPLRARRRRRGARPLAHAAAHARAPRAAALDDGARRPRAGDRPASPHSWEESLAHLGRPANAERAELTIGYRLPGAILDLANRLLPYAARGRRRRRARCATPATRRICTPSTPTSSSTRSPSTRSRSPRRWRRSP